MRLYTRTGDDGTTALRQGVRVAKASAAIEALGALDEAQAFLGAARAEADPSSALDELLIQLERDLWVAMAAVATPSGVSAAPGSGAMSDEMVVRLEAAIDTWVAATEIAPHFAVPGDNRLTAALDVARTVVRRAERRVAACEGAPPLVLAYLNRLGDLCFALARATEGSHRVQRRRERTGDDDGAAGTERARGRKT